MKKKLVIFGIIIGFLLLVFVIVPKILIISAESSLDSDPAMVDTNDAAPGPEFYSAIRLLNIAAWSPFWSKSANDINIHFSLKTMGKYKLACFALETMAKDKAWEATRKEYKEKMKRARGNLKKMEKISKEYGFTGDSLDWKSHINPKEKKALCSRWKEFSGWVRKQDADPGCSVCQ